MKFYTLVQQLTIPLSLILMASCQNQNKPSVKQSVTADTPVRSVATELSCLDDPTVDACIFWKNPVAQEGQPLPHNMDLSTHLRDLQIYGINLKDFLIDFSEIQQPFQFGADPKNNPLLGFQPHPSPYSMIELTDQGFSYVHEPSAGLPLRTPQAFSPYDEDSHFLENPSYRITINYGDAQRVTPREDGSWKFEYGHPDHPTAQIMTYYYLMSQIKWMEEHAGGWYAKNKNITVVAVDEDFPNNAVWSSQNNTISLGVLCHPQSPGQSSCLPRMEMALNAEITLHEAGHANFYYSVDRRLSLGGYCLNHQHNDGGQLLSVCDEKYLTDHSVRNVFCNKEKGCFFAIREGASDFQSVLMHPNAPQIGETLANNTDGLTCPTETQIHRNPQANQQITAQHLFNNCSTNRMSGEVHQMGILYTSLWWSLYTHSEADPSEMAQIFTNHLPLITYDDTFETAGYKIMSLNHTFYRGKYTKIIEEEFQKRGLRLMPDPLSF